MASVRSAGRGMAVATVVSRGAGFVRIVVLAAALGYGTRLLDTYNVANTLPNAVFELVVGGAMASVVVPLLARAAVTETDDGVIYAQRLLSLMVYSLSLVTVVAVAAAPWLVRAYAPGFTGPQRELAVVFCWYFLPQILFYGVGATAGAVLNMRGRFGAPAWAPVVNSVVVIAVAAIYLAVGGSTRIDGLQDVHLLLLALGTTAGVAAQTLLVVFALARSGFPVRLHLDPRGIAVRRIGRLGAWVLLSVVAAQVLLAAATRAASLSGPGGVTSYQTAYAIFQVPVAVVALSVMTAMLPRLSRSAARRDHERVIGDLSLAVRVAAVTLAPAAVALLVLGRPIATLLFGHGTGVATLGTVLAAFGLALLPFTAYTILQRGFYALQDTKTPALITATVSVAGIAGCAAATWLLPASSIVVGVALAYAAAYTVGLLATALLLRRRLGRIDGHRIVRTHAKVLLAAGVAGTGAALAGNAVLAGAVGLVLYAAAVLALRLPELRQLQV